MTDQIELFDRRFHSLHKRSVEAVNTARPEILFAKEVAIATGRVWVPCSFGESLLRSAAAVEQTFGGITTRLWDDPFEWTLPEELSTKDKIAAYLNEVEGTRLKGFRSFASDAELSKMVQAPDRFVSIFELLLETLARAEHLQGRAVAILRLLSEVPLPRKLDP